uniref:uncharacterized protein LOC120329791 n=1 Tax=Styela clava TaxID=7725 RepID=UPI00193A2A83|nr:uncharacterized protein LOC120329791 [Styela clava]
MHVLFSITVACMIFGAGRCITCHECNIYGSETDVHCPLRECPPEYSVCSTITYTPTADPDLGELDCYHEQDNGTSYRGTWSTTIYGQDCLPWDASENFTYAASHGIPGLGSHNHCRNPDGDFRPWCYTTYDSDFSYCAVPKCFTHLIPVEERRCGWKNQEYCKDDNMGKVCTEVCDEDNCNVPPDYEFEKTERMLTEDPTTSTALETSAAVKTSTFISMQQTSKGEKHVVSRDESAKLGRSSHLRQEQDNDDGDESGSITTRPSFILISLIAPLFALLF